MAVWHWRQCGDGRPSTDATENLLHGGGASGAQDAIGHLAQRADLFGAPRSTRGRTSLDSTVSCVVCMDGAINCVLMPCAHEIACQRCASRLVLCPVCRMPVGSTLKIAAADFEERERAAALANANAAAAAQQLQEPEQQQQQQLEQQQQQDAEGGGLQQAEEGSAGPAGDGAAGSDDAEDEGCDGADAAAPGEAKPAAASKASSGMAAMLCLRCAANPPNCVFLPCSHKVWCTECAAQLPPTCPICNTGITQSLRTFHKRL